MVSTTPAFHEMSAPASTLEGATAEMQAIDTHFEAATDEEARTAAVDEWARLECPISTGAPWSTSRDP
jgi:hypothetical protein